MFNLAGLLFEIGDLEAANKELDVSLAMAREIGYRPAEFFQVAGLGDVLFARGKLAEAQTQYENSLLRCKELDDKNSAAQVQTSLSSVA